MKRIALSAALCWAALPVMSETVALPSDATEIEKAAYAVLDKHCARCHQDGALEDGLTSAKSGFGHVLDLRRLAEPIAKGLLARDTLLAPYVTPVTKVQETTLRGRKGPTEVWEIPLDAEASATGT